MFGEKVRLVGMPIATGMQEVDFIMGGITAPNLEDRTIVHLPTWIRDRVSYFDLPRPTGLPMIFRPLLPDVKKKHLEFFRESLKKSKTYPLHKGQRVYNLKVI